MLNRTNRTLSALALSNRLNLGTRSLAANASVNRGDQSLLVRQSHRGVMHDGMMWYQGFSVPKPATMIPLIPGSFSQVSQCQLSCVTEQRSLVAVDVRVEAEPRPADLVGRLEPRIRSRRLPAQTTVPQTGDTTPDVTDSRSRTSETSSGIPGLKRTARRAAHESAAIRSATAGK
jgi:hypothetical protein